MVKISILTPLLFFIIMGISILETCLSTMRLKNMVKANVLVYHQTNPSENGLDKDEMIEPVDRFVCIHDGTIQSDVNQSNVLLASPFFPDGLSLPTSTEYSSAFQDSNTPSSFPPCSNLTSDGKTHVFFSVRHTQYGHFLLNCMAPLWEKLRIAREHRLYNNTNNLVLHMFTPETNFPSYLQSYLSFFGADEIHIENGDKLSKTTLLAKNPVLGLSNATLDHYNYRADAKLWQGFRRFLLEGFARSGSHSSVTSAEPKKNSTHLRVTFLQRKSNRRTLNLDALLEGTQSLLLNYTANKSRAVRNPQQQQPLEAIVRTAQFEGMALEDQARIMSETDILVAADGTGLINGMYMPLKSCIVSILPYGVRELLPRKGKKFENMFQDKLDTKYVTLHSQAVKESKKVYERAAAETDPIARWFMLKQDIDVSMDHLGGALVECLDYVA